MCEEDNEALLRQWTAAEREAVQVEMKVAALGQGAADPRAAALYKDALEKRAKADAMFHEIYVLTKQSPAPSQD